MIDQWFGVADIITIEERPFQVGNKKRMRYVGKIEREDASVVTVLFEPGAPPPPTFFRKPKPKPKVEPLPRITNYDRLPYGRLMELELELEQQRYFQRKEHAYQMLRLWHMPIMRHELLGAPVNPAKSPVPVKYRRNV